MCVRACVCVCPQKRYVHVSIFLVERMSKCLRFLSVELSPEDGRVQRKCFDESQKYIFDEMERQYVCVAAMAWMDVVGAQFNH